MEIYHPELLQEWRLNIDAAEYEQNIENDLYKPSKKRNYIVLIAVKTGQHQ